MQYRDQLQFQKFLAEVRKYADLDSLFHLEDEELLRLPRSCSHDYCTMWRPLERCLAHYGLSEFLESFMWMGHCGAIQLYKHRMTRRYLNLDYRGKAYSYHGDNVYRRQNMLEAIAALI